MTVRRASRLPAVVAAVTALLFTLLVGCTGDTPVPAASPTAAAASSSYAARTFNIDITIRARTVSPSGHKLDVNRGAAVVLQIDSDQDDTIHAHTGDGGYTVKVHAGQLARGQFTASDIDSFDIESHKLDKIIVILNVR